MRTAGSAKFQRDPQPSGGWVYRLGDKRIPSVTEVLSVSADNTARYAGGLPPDEAARVGQEAHARIAAGAWSAPYANAARRFLDDHQLTVEAAEVHGASTRLGVAGRIDMIVSTADGTLAVVEWKTNTGSPDFPALTAAAARQAAAHTDFDIIEGIPVVTELAGWVVSLNADGSYSHRQVNPAPNLEWFERCLALWQVEDDQARSPTSLYRHPLADTRQGPTLPTAGVVIEDPDLPTAVTHGEQDPTRTVEDPDLPTAASASDNAPPPSSQDRPTPTNRLLRRIRPRRSG